uniref:Uncharacterized protein n=1 Tax=Anguilla anguilla TaxID=7936 RepID=A0A0E9R9M4_ANGAN
MKSPPASLLWVSEMLMYFGNPGVPFNKNKKSNTTPRDLKMEYFIHTDALIHLPQIYIWS